MPKMIHIGFVLCLLIIGNNAYAENPWNQHYAARGDMPARPHMEERSHTEEHAFEITYADVENVVARALQQQNAGETLRVMMPKRPEEIAVSYREPLEMEIDQLSYDAKSRTWQAMLYYSAGARTLAPVKISGRYEEIAAIPILKHRVGGGQMIEPDDIELKAFPTQRLQKQTVIDPAQIIGKCPKRTISAGRPIRIDEVVTMPVVNKGEMVSLVYKTPQMEIRTLGEATENGATGDIIKIRNLTSHIVVQATITGKGLAQVNPPAAAVTAALEVAR